FFSSRRRHTRLVSDWSSDVCSSDLAMGAFPAPGGPPPGGGFGAPPPGGFGGPPGDPGFGAAPGGYGAPPAPGGYAPPPAGGFGEIGRASCRERAESAGVACVRARKG